MEEKTIFEELNEKNICYSVMVNLITSNLKSIKGNKKEFFIIIHRKDKSKVKGFYNTDNYKHIIYERELIPQEVDRFKKTLCNFVKVKHDADGRVYELKNNSFKEMYDTIKQYKQWD
jgi:hypothetical protein